MKLSYIRELIKDLPDDADVFYNDPNFSGKYYMDPEEYDFEVVNGALYISFPFEEIVD